MNLAICLPIFQGDVPSGAYAGGAFQVRPSASRSVKTAPMSPLLPLRTCPAGLLKEPTPTTLGSVVFEMGITPRSLRSTVMLTPRAPGGSPAVDGTRSHRTLISAPIQRQGIAIERNATGIRIQTAKALPGTPLMRSLPEGCSASLVSMAQGIIILALFGGACRAITA